jgi:HEPN domain-containing protein
VPSNRPSVGTPQEWLARAKSSLAIAKQTPESDGIFWEDLCFPAQQAAEKALKAIYQHQGLTFRYTHDLEELGTGLERNQIPIPDFVKDAVVLTKYASEARYPGVYEAVTQEEYQEAVKLAGAVVLWAEELISVAH